MLVAPVRWLLPLLVVTTGCDLIFKLNGPSGEDAPPVPPDTLPVLGDCPPRSPIHDEDEDGVMDAFDNCPAEYNDGQADTDGDGLGDFCDPHVNDATTPDRMCFFGFNDPSDLEQFTAVPVQDWEVTGGRLRLTRINMLSAIVSKASFTGALMIVRANGLSDASGFTVRLTAGVSTKLLGMNGEEGVGCAIEHAVGPPGGDAPAYLFRLPFGGGGESVDGIVAQEEDFLSIVVRAEGSDNKPACSVDHGGAPLPLFLDGLASSSGRAGVSVENATVEIGSITIVGREE